MSQLGERIVEVKARIDSLSSRVNSFLGASVEPDSISRFKRRLQDGPLTRLETRPYHKGTVQASLKLKMTIGEVEGQILIDDLLDEPTSNLSYEFSNTDFKSAPQELIGIVYRSDGIVITEKMLLSYEPRVKRYILKVLSDRECPQMRLFIVAHFAIGLEDYAPQEVDLRPISQTVPGSGDQSRSTPAKMSFPMLTLKNPFQ